MLPDDVLLHIFHFYVNEAEHTEAWQTLVHVCGRWRRLVFASSHRLKLQLLYSPRRPVRRMLRVWPAFPIAINAGDIAMTREEGARNVVAALGHSGRINEVNIRGVPNSLLRRFAALPPAPFPALTSLHLGSKHKSPLVLPSSFMGASAPRLQLLVLDNIPYLGLHDLLSSATELVDLSLLNVPHSGYISPEAMVTCISGMTKLRSLRLVFQSPLSRPDQVATGKRPPPLKRALLPALTSLYFRGISEYLDDFVAQVDAPLLHNVTITFFNQLILNVSQLPQFLDRTGELREPIQADIVFSRDKVTVTVSGKTLRIACKDTDWQFSALSQVCSSTLRCVRSLKRLNIRERFPRPHWQDDMENLQWVELLRPFAAVEDFYLSEELASRVVPALQELTGDEATEVLPVLQNIFLDRHCGSESPPPWEAIGKFVAERHLSGHPVSVHRRERGTGTSAWQDINGH
jgi:hypothetical protein